MMNLHRRFQKIIQKQLKSLEYLKDMSFHQQVVDKIKQNTKYKNQRRNYNWTNEKDAPVQ